MKTLTLSKVTEPYDYQPPEVLKTTGVVVKLNGKLYPVSKSYRLLDDLDNEFLVIEINEEEQKRNRSFVKRIIGNLF